MSKKKEFKEIRDILSKDGYKLIREYFLKRGRRVIEFSDSCGYKYSTYYDNYVQGYSPRMVFSTNKYSTSNIRKWLKKNNKMFSLCRTSKYTNVYTKMKFKCHICKDYFYSNWSYISSGNGCGVCNGSQVGKRHSLYHTDRKFVKEWSPKNKITPKEVKRSSNKSVIWNCHICKKDYKKVIYKRVILNQGCPLCNKISKGEEKIFEILNRKKVKSIKQKRFINCKKKKALPFDFYLPDYNLCIEYHGEQHYQEVKFFGGKSNLNERKINDKIKKKYCLDNNINFLVIPHWEYSNIENILEKTLSELR